MHSPNLYEERRGSTRRHVFHTVKMLTGADTAPRDCLILGISDGGVRLYVVGFDVPDEFDLLLPATMASKNRINSRSSGGRTRKWAPS